jgi:hypothetical protein
VRPADGGEQTGGGDEGEAAAAGEDVGDAGLADGGAASSPLRIAALTPPRMLQLIRAGDGKSARPWGI